MSENRIIVLVAAGLILLDIIWLLIRGKKNGFVEKDQFSKVMVLRIVSGYTMALCLILILWFREFGMIGDIVLCGCSVLGVEIENRLLLGTVSEYDDEEYQ